MRGLVGWFPMVAASRLIRQILPGRLRLPARLLLVGQRHTDQLGVGVVTMMVAEAASRQPLERLTVPDKPTPSSPGELPCFETPRKS